MNMTVTSSGTVGLAIIAKTPEPGKSKTRLSPPLTPRAVPAFRLLSLAISRRRSAISPRRRRFRGVALYTPIGSEPKLRRLLPDRFALVPQSKAILARASIEASPISWRSDTAAIIVSSDCPTLPDALFRRAADLLLNEDCIVLCPAYDGGYIFIGARRPHARLFEDMPWSTEVVFEITLERARETGLPVHVLPMWYDVDDAETLEILKADLAGAPLPFATEDFP